MAIEAAERLSAAADSELGGLLGIARERLQHARQEETAAKKVVAIETMESECVALALSHGACAEGGLNVMMMTKENFKPPAGSFALISVTLGIRCQLAYLDMSLASGSNFCSLQ